eukprot:585452-Karenia_brevis.AAC.1
MSWPSSDLFVLSKMMGGGVLTHLEYVIKNTTVSSCCSGLMTPETSDAMLCSALSDILGRAVPEPFNVYGMDWNPESRAESMSHPNSPAHMFGDMLDFYHDATLNKIRSLQSH